LVIFIP